MCTFVQSKKGMGLYMGLTSSSTGSTLFNDNYENLKTTSDLDFTVALSGNPNVREV